MLIVGTFQTTRFFKSLFVSILFLFATNSLMYSLGVLLFLTFSFAFNDFVDANKDSIGHPERAIPSGKISRRNVLALSIILFILGILIAVKTDFLIGFLIAFSFSLIYSSLLKPYIPILATFIWSLSVAIVFIQPFSREFLDFLGFMLVVYAYETLLDYRDIFADNQFCKTPTLAAIAGRYFIVLAILTAIAGFLLLFR